MLLNLKNAQTLDASPDGTKYNQLPTDAREVSQENILISMLSSAQPDAIEYRQILLDRVYMSAWVYWYWDQTSVVMVFDRLNERIRWFTAGCEHSFQRKGRYTECVNCGFSMVPPDSSD